MLSRPPRLLRAAGSIETGAMGDLRAAFRTGEHGVRWEPPAGAEVVEEGPRLLVMRDGAAGLLWHVTVSALPFALAPDDALREDLERSAREAFAEAWQAPGEGAVGATFGGGVKRTDDPAWSPVVEHAVVDVAGGRALRLVRRLTYQPGNEIVAGHLVLPTAHGHIDLCALARAGTTGARESVVSLMRSKLDAEADAPDQADFDDAAIDAHFPEHPLSMVRAALAALPGHVEVTAAPAVPAAEVALPEASCAFVPPPRFAPVAPGVMRFHRTMRVLLRCGIGAWRRSIEVWRLDDVPLRRRDPRRELATLAREVAARWSDEGFTDVNGEVAIVDDFGERPQVEQRVAMTGAGRPIRSVLRWWVEPDGVVYRVGSSGPHAVPDTDHSTALDAVQATWRRLDPVAGPHRPWWRVW
jgi:hypothetical protein